MATQLLVSRGLQNVWKKKKNLRGMPKKLIKKGTLESLLCVLCHIDDHNTSNFFFKTGDAIKST